MHKHLQVLAALYIGFGVLLASIGIFVAILLPMIGMFADDPDAFPVLTTIGVFVGAFLLLLAVPGIVGGVGLLKRRPWARILVLILGAIHVFNVPLGTLLGAYTIWVLVQDETERLFEGPAPTTPTAPATTTIGPATTA